MRLPLLCLSILSAGILSANTAIAEDVLIPVGCNSSVSSGTSSFFPCESPSSGPFGSFGSFGLGRNLGRAFNPWAGWDEFYGNGDGVVQDGFAMHGWSALEYSRDSWGFERTALGMQKDLSYEIPVNSNRFGFGAILDVYAEPGFVNADALPYVYAGFGNHKITAGYVEDAWNKLIPRVPAGYGLRQNYRFYQLGARYDGIFNGGNTEVSASILDNDYLSGAFSHRFGPTKVYGAFEAMTGGGGIQSATLGGYYEPNKNIMLYGAYRKDFPWNTSGFSFGATYQPIDRVELSGGVQLQEGFFGSATILSAGAAVGIREGIAAYGTYQRYDPQIGPDTDVFYLGIRSEF